MGMVRCRWCAVKLIADAWFAQIHKNIEIDFTIFSTGSSLDESKINSISLLINSHTQVIFCPGPLYKNRIDYFSRST